MRIVKRAFKRDQAEDREAKARELEQRQRENDRRLRMLEAQANVLRRR